LEKANISIGKLNLVREELERAGKSRKLYKVMNECL
jgi:hypothetical protein